MSLRGEHYKFTAEEFARMIEQGYFGKEDRVELLNGEIIIMHAIGRRHAQAVTALNAHFGEHNHRRYYPSPQNPVELERYSAPQPDLCLVARSYMKSKSHPKPSDVYLIMEVADSSLEYDRGPKMAAYSRCGIGEFWILNLVDDVLEIFRNPSGEIYQEQLVVPASGTAAPQAFPDLLVPLSEIMPDR